MSLTGSFCHTPQCDLDAVGALGTVKLRYKRCNLILASSGTGGQHI